MADLTQNPSASQQAMRWLKTPWTLSALLLVAVALLDPGNFQTVVTFALKALAHTGRYILFAVLLLSYLKATGAETMVARAFEGREVRMIVLAAMFGGLAPFCSCEVIPFIAGLLALGAPLSAVMAFWLSSPLIDPPTLLITAGALGWPFAIGKAVAAVGLGLFGGFAIKALMGYGVFANPLKQVQKSSCCGCGAPKLDAKPVWAFWGEAARRETFRREFVSNGLFLLKWLALAYVLEALLVSYVPADMIAGLVGGEGVGPIAVAALVGMPAYLNSYVAPPLLAGLVEQGMSAGAAMAFMIAGAVSSIPAMAAVWSLVKPQVFATYLILGVSGAILSGILFQML
ncbi:permease [Phaeobacter sp. QD34_3]|uniref:permease n=1 Tax=unclassified Phaeobacter TaxID=2621772 RepID=UPI00237F1F76|nr:MULTISPECIES: permease [unclassified Phaeobacter]MDE4132640.1 permease [Phaeobacter sp. QD34_3]MDE4136276.1 permease [Phaeobacter sp. QD34_24]MDE4174364.1 permease [Phaeobacter sp. PT47_59]